MPAPYDPLDTTTPEYSGPYLIEYPFAEVGDNTSIVASRDGFVQSEYYAPPTLNEALTLTTPAATLYCVGDYNVTRSETGLTSFTRKWATVPADRIEPGGTATATIPYVAAWIPSSSITTQLFRAVGTLTKNQYFRVGSGGTYTDATLIPVLLPNSTIAIDDQTGEIAVTVIAGPGSAGDYTYLLEPSSVSRYMGNIWVREARYFKEA